MNERLSSSTVPRKTPHGFKLVALWCAIGFFFNVGALNRLARTTSSPGTAPTWFGIVFIIALVVAVYVVVGVARAARIPTVLALGLLFFWPGYFGFKLLVSGYRSVGIERLFGIVVVFSVASAWYLLRLPSRVRWASSTAPSGAPGPSPGPA